MVSIHVTLCSLQVGIRGRSLITQGGQDRGQTGGRRGEVGSLKVAPHSESLSSQHCPRPAAISWTLRLLTTRHIMRGSNGILIFRQLDEIRMHM